MSFTDVLTALPYVKAGKLRALGVTTATRSQALPDVPTVAEQGVHGLRRQRVLRHRRAGGHAAGSHRQAQRGLRRGAGARPRCKQLFAAQGLEPAPSTDARAAGQVHRGADDASGPAWSSSPARSSTERRSTMNTPLNTGALAGIRVARPLAHPRRARTAARSSATTAPTCSRSSRRRATTRAPGARPSRTAWPPTTTA